MELDNVIGVVGVNAKVLVSMSVLTGDVNQSGAVTVEDIALVQANTGVAVTGSTFKYDTTHNGAINSSDIAQTKALNGNSFYPDFAFTGHFYHARSGLYLAPYRAYHPTIGRWLSRDPYGTPPFEMRSTPWRRFKADRFLSREEPEMLPEGPNLYEYVSNNPVSSLDILGLFKPQAEGCDDFPDALENRCVKQCCDEHDRCYERNGCSMYSWGFQVLPINWSRCDKCNTTAARCVTKALATPSCWNKCPKK